jgi:hypothetical protein
MVLSAIQTPQSVDNSPVKTRTSRAMSDPMKLDATLSGDSPVMNETLPTQPTVEEMKTWEKNEVLQWIQQRRPKLLQDDDLKNFKEANFSGEAFLLRSREDFRECGLSFGVRLVLESLVNEVKAPPAVQQGKLHRHIHSYQ